MESSIARDAVASAADVRVGVGFPYLSEEISAVFFLPPQEKAEKKEKIKTAEKMQLPGDIR